MGKLGANRVRKPVAELVEQVGTDCVIVRNQEASVVLSVRIVRQERVHHVGRHILPVEPRIDLLLRIDNLIDPPIEPVRLGRNWLQGFIVEAAIRRNLRYAIYIGQRIVVVQQRRGGSIDAV
jgi:hypothetical protein